jgi:hypothetical protein
MTGQAQFDPVPLGVVAERLGRLIAERRLGFLAAAMTPWHAIGVDAWVRHLRAGGEKRPGAVVMLPHFRDGLGLDASKFPLTVADGGVQMHPVSVTLAPSGTRRLIQLAATAGRVAGLWASRPGPAGRPGLPALSIASPGYAAAGVFLLTQFCNLRAARSADVRFVCIDEGIGTYVSQAVWDAARKGDRPRQGRIVGGRRADDLLYRIWKRAQASVAGGYPQESRFVFAKDQATGRLMINEPVAEDYRRAIGATAGSRDVLERTALPIAIILSQPWAEASTNPAEGQAQFDLLCRVSARLAKAGYDVCLKPHPREQAGKYGEAVALGAAGFRLIAGEHAAERMFNSMRPGDIVIGYNSSALMTARLLFGLGTYTLSHLLAGMPQVGEWFSTAQKAFDLLAGPSVRPFEDEFGVP